MPYTIDFEPVGRRGPCPEDGTLLDAARSLGVDLASYLELARTPRFMRSFAEAMYL